MQVTLSQIALVYLYIEMLTQIWVYILLGFLSKEIWLPVKQHGYIKQDSKCYLKHLITIESEGVGYGYFVLLYMWLI